MMGDGEQVIRHRGGGRDENGQLLTTVDQWVTVTAIAPGGGSPFVEKTRDGETILCTVYFPIGTDVVDSDELTVRGERFTVVVNDWRLSGFGGLEVLCTRGHG